MSIIEVRRHRIASIINNNQSQYVSLSSCTRKCLIVMSTRNHCASHAAAGGLGCYLATALSHDASECKTFRGRRNKGGRFREMIRVTGGRWGLSGRQIGGEEKHRWSRAGGRKGSLPAMNSADMAASSITEAKDGRRMDCLAPSPSVCPLSPRRR